MIEFRIALGDSFSRARSRWRKPAGNIPLDTFRPAIDSRGYITVNASQVLGDKELSFGLGVARLGPRLLHFATRRGNTATPATSTT